MSRFPRTVLHGIDQSAPTFRDLPNTGNEATLCLEEAHMNTWLYDPDIDAWWPYEYLAFEYDFASDGGNIGFVNLDVEVPRNTLVFDGVLDVIDVFTSGGAATIAIQLEAADDILVAGNLAANGTIGLHDVVPDGTAANTVRCTAARQLKMDIRVAALTAGKLIGFLRCFRGFDLEEQSSSSSSTQSSSSSSSSSTASSASTSSSSPSSSTVAQSTSSSSTSVAFSSSSSSLIFSSSTIDDALSTSSTQAMSTSSSSSLGLTSSSSSSLEFSTSSSSSSSIEFTSSSSSSEGLSGSSSSSSTSAQTDF